jgi:hypothetical protein
MSILEWFQLLSVNELPSNLSQNLLSQNSNAYVFIAYVVISILIKRAAFLAAFFMSCMLFEMHFFDPLSEASLYLLTFAIYSYVITCNTLTFKQRLACGIILILSITLAYDATFYGINGYYGAHETFVYNNIEYLALYAHLILISSLIPYRRIRDGLRDMLSTIVYVSRNSVNFALL